MKTNPCTNATRKAAPARPEDTDTYDHRSLVHPLLGYRVPAISFCRPAPVHHLAPTALKLAERRRR